MGYPSGGKRLESITSTEKNAYINLTCRANQDTKTVLVASVIKSAVTFAIGTTTRGDNNYMIRTWSSNRYWCLDYGGEYIQMPETTVNIGTKTTFILDRNVGTIGEFTAKVPDTDGITFESGELLLLAGKNTSGGIVISNGTIWSCQVYDNGTLVRDCVPWELEDGSVGLWDVVNETFYPSAGSAQFVPNYVEDVLPDGCEKVEYLRTTGKEYINTGIIPTGKTRLVMDAKVLPTQSENSYVFGMMKSGAFYWSVQFNNKLFSTRYAAQSETAFSSGLTAGVRYTIDKNRHITNIGSETITGTASESSGDVPIYLFARNSGNVADRFCQVEAWSCRIFEDDIPLQDLVVVRNADGELGFYDLISGTVFLNAGTGAFETGEIIVTETEHSTVIDGTVYKLESGSVMIGGTVYEVENGRVMVDGVVYDVPFGVAEEPQEMVVFEMYLSGPEPTKIVVNGITYSAEEDFGHFYLLVPKGSVIEFWDYDSVAYVDADWNVVWEISQDSDGNPYYLTADHGMEFTIDVDMGDRYIRPYEGEAGTYRFSIAAVSSDTRKDYQVCIDGTWYFPYDRYEFYLKPGTVITVENAGGTARSIEFNDEVVVEANVNASYTFAMPEAHTFVTGSYASFIRISTG